MRSILIFIYRFIKKLELCKYNIQIGADVVFNDKTCFGGHNTIAKDCNISNSEIGRFTYLGESCQMSNCEIGSFCSIAAGVKVIADTHPTNTFVSTSPVFFSTLKQCGSTFVSENKFNEHRSINGRKVIIGNDVWIGSNSIIAGGITIGNGAIVAMGAVVTKDVPPYAIVGGVPAKVIRYRFSESQINYLLSTQWWNKDIEWLKINAEKFNNIESFKI